MWQWCESASRIRMSVAQVALGGLDHSCALHALGGHAASALYLRVPDLSLISKGIGALLLYMRSYEYD